MHRTLVMKCHLRESSILKSFAANRVSMKYQKHPFFVKPADKRIYLYTTAFSLSDTDPHKAFTVSMDIIYSPVIVFA
jgi:hypothetical protein